MKKFDKFISKINFKKVAITYIIIALVLGIACCVTVGVVFSERLNFAYQYSKLEDAVKSNDTSAIKDAVKNTSSSSSDIVDILVLNGNNDVTYSAKNSNLAKSSVNLECSDKESKYLTAAEIPDTTFKYVKNDEFMLNSIISKDFDQINKDYDSDHFFSKNLSNSNVYMLSCINSHHSDSKVYVISKPTAVPNGMLELKISAVVAVLIACIYWVLIALWMYKDAYKSKLYPVLWGLIGLFTNVIGLIVYLIYKKGNVTCDKCGASQSQSHLFCNYCGNKLGKACSKCGNKINSKDCFCSKCGNKIN